MSLTALAVSALAVWPGFMVTLLTHNSLNLEVILHCKKKECHCQCALDCESPREAFLCIWTHTHIHVYRYTFTVYSIYNIDTHLHIYWPIDTYIHIYILVCELEFKYLLIFLAYRKTMKKEWSSWWCRLYFNIFSWW